MLEEFKGEESTREEEDGSEERDGSDDEDGSEDEDESDDVDGSDDEDESEEEDGSDQEGESEDVGSSDDEDDSGSDDEDESEEEDGSDDEGESEEAEGSEDEEEEDKESGDLRIESKPTKEESAETTDWSKLAETMNLDEFEEEEPVVITLKPGLEFVPRTTWRALPPTHRWPLKNPVQCVRMNKTTGLPCDTLLRCCRALRRLQENHIKYHDLADIAYNFMVGGDGRIYEGRGWEVEGILREGEEDLSEKSIVFAYIGNYNKRNPVPPMLEFQVDKFLEWAVENGKVHRRALKYEWNERYEGIFPEHKFKEEEEKIPHMRKEAYDNYEFKSIEEEVAYLESIRPSPT